MPKKQLLSYLMFIYFSAGAILFPCFSIYLSSFLTPYEIGILMAIIPVSMMLFQPFWGKAADKYGVFHILILNLTLTAISATGFFFAKTFTAMFAVLAAYSVFCVSVLPLLDTLILTTNHAQYGRIRLWGSIGYGISIFAAGLLKSRLLGFWTFMIHITALLAALVIVLKLQRRKEIGKSAKVSGQAGQSSPLLDRRLLPLFASSMLIGMVMKAYDTFYPIGLSNLNASDFLLGTAWVASTIPEVLIFYILDRFGERINSSYILFAGIAAYAVRMSLLAGFPVLWVWVASQPISSLAFCFWYYGTIKTMNGMLADQQKSRGNTLFWAIAYGAGGVTGSLISGIMVSSSGIPSMFFTAVLVSSSAFLPYAFSLHLPGLRH